MVAGRTTIGKKTIVGPLNKNPSTLNSAQRLPGKTKQDDIKSSCL